MNIMATVQTIAQRFRCAIHSVCFRRFLKSADGQCSTTRTKNLMVNYY